MNKLLKIILSILFAIILMVVTMVGLYITLNRQYIIKDSEHGSVTSEKSILIASQGSEFKGALVNKIIRHFKNDSTYIFVTDCTRLAEIKSQKWDAIIVVHATQVHGMPGSTEKFLKRLADISKVIIVSTSGSGDELYEGLDCDAVSSASRLSNLEGIFQWCTPRIERMLTAN